MSHRRPLSDQLSVRVFDSSSGDLLWAYDSTFLPNDDNDTIPTTAVAPSKVKCPLCREEFEHQAAMVQGNSFEGKGFTTRRVQDCCSHKARIIVGSFTSPCPICLDENAPSPMVALRCGHLLCRDDFQMIGGRVGWEALAPTTGQRPAQDWAEQERRQPEQRRRIVRARRTVQSVTEQQRLRQMEQQLRQMEPFLERLQRELQVAMHLANDANALFEQSTAAINASIAVSAHNAFLTPGESAVRSTAVANANSSSTTATTINNSHPRAQNDGGPAVRP